MILRCKPDSLNNRNKNRQSTVKIFSIDLEGVDL